MPMSKAGATLYHAQLGLPNKGFAIKELVVFYSTLYPGISYPWLLDLTLKCQGQHPRPYEAIKYRGIIIILYLAISHQFKILIYLQSNKSCLIHEYF